MFALLISDSVSSSQRSRSREYCPKAGSGGHAILLALYLESIKPGYPGYMVKSDLIKKAQPFTETDLSLGRAGASGPTSWYTGWSSVPTLVNADLDSIPLLNSDRVL